MTTNPHIETIIAFINTQMDGEQVPPANSTAIESLGKAIGGLQKANRDEDWQMLGVSALGAAIDRVRSGIEAQKTFHKFIGGNDHV